MVESTNPNPDQEFQDIVDGKSIANFTHFAHSLLAGGDLDLGNEGDDMEFEIVDNGNQNAEDDYFDNVVGCL